MVANQSGHELNAHIPVWQEATMSNRICEILGIEKPVIQGPMVWLTDVRLAAAVSNAGGMGSLGPNAGQTVVTRDPEGTSENMRAEIRKVRELTAHYAC